ncbi:MAG: hypothetical protein RIE77_13065 [Phycisphaerales bacterium]|jgi:hypothetical protein
MPPADSDRQGPLAPGEALVDHRAKKCGTIRELRSPPHFLWFMRPDVPLARETLVRVRITFALWCGSFAILVFLLASATRPFTSWIGRTPHWLDVALLIAVGVSVIGFFIARGVASRHWRTHGRHGAAMLLAARGQCPACAAWLLTTRPDDDGRTTCPSCSAGWKVGNEGGCPGCGYDMRRVPATAGPLAICPECATLSAARLVGASGASRVEASPQAEASP